MLRKLAFTILAALGAGGCYDEGTSLSDDGSNALASADSIQSFAADGWSIQTVDPTAGAGLDPALKFNSSGYPAIAYLLTGPVLKFAQWTGSAWNVQIVANPGGSNPSLSFDPTGMPAITFHFGTPKKPGDRFLKLARWNGASWVVENIDTKASGTSSLAFDPSGQPVVAYAAESGTQLKLARKSGSTWTTEIVDTLPLTISWLSLSTSPSGFPAIAYSARPTLKQSGPHSLKYAQKPGSTWFKQVVESGVEGMGSSASLAFDPATGHPTIYHGWANSVPPQCGKRFVSWTGSAWVGEEVDTRNWSAFGELTYDSAGRPIVTHRLLTSGGPPDVLYFGRKTDGAWVLEPVDTALTRLDGPSGNISIGYQDTAYIAYRNNNVLKLARRDAP